MTDKDLIYIKGGSCHNVARDCQSADCDWGLCNFSYYLRGFRIMLRKKNEIPSQKGLLSLMTTYRGNSMKPPIFSFPNNLLPTFRAIFDPEDSSIALGQTLITQEQWREVVERFHDCGLNPDPSYFKGDTHPVESVSYEEVIRWIGLLNQILEEEGSEFRADLPTEEEWEYFARAGRSPENSVYPTGKTISPELANYGSHYKGTTPVGSFPANPWGFYDLAGNVYEVIKPVVEKVKTETEIQIENLQRQLDQLKSKLAEAVK